MELKHKCTAKADRAHRRHAITSLQYYHTQESGRIHVDVR